MKGWEKTRLTEGIDFDDRIFEEPDNEEEILLQNAMEELMIEDNTESITEDLLSSATSSKNAKFSKNHPGGFIRRIFLCIK